ncbi:MAG: 4-(cytidine 5'-diphospho)-2-C-methyl-D-erythritol kinase [Bacilli bacterium]|jgi:4-diphosphocytidyl-2-C-methyl-D-erythritol kinase
MKKKAYAKINLSLRVLRKREDNYHDLESVMCKINLFDKLTFKKNKLKINRIINDIYPDNLVLKTANLIKEKYKIKQGLDIKIKKQIPTQAGLGGGSSDAACTIIALNKLFKLNLNINEMIEIAANLGSDIAYCLFDEIALVSGKGEKIKVINTKLNPYLVLIKPDFKCSTKTIFENHKITESNNLEVLIKAFEENNLKEVCNNLSNDLETTVNNLFDNEIALIKETLIKAGALNALMTGSGSVVFGVFENKKTAKTSYLKLKKEVKNKKVYFCKIKNN